MAVKEYYTTGQIAKMLTVTARTVQKWADKGILQGWRLPLSGDRRISREAIVKFCESRNIAVPEELRAA